MKDVMYSSRVPLQKEKWILQSLTLYCVASWCLLLKITWSRSKAMTFSWQSMIYMKEHKGRNPTASTSPLWVMSWYPSSWAFTHIWHGHAETACSKGNQGRGGLLWINPTVRTHLIRGNIYNPVFASPLHALQRRQRGLCPCVPGQHFLVCLFSTVEVSKLQKKSNKLRPSKRLLLSDNRSDHLASNSSAKWKITIVWFYFADRSCRLSGPHTEVLWAPRDGSSPQHPRMGSGWGTLCEPPKTRFGWQGAPK